MNIIHYKILQNFKVTQECLAPFFHLCPKLQMRCKISAWKVCEVKFSSNVLLQIFLPRISRSLCKMTIMITYIAKVLLLNNNTAYGLLERKKNKTREQTFPNYSSGIVDLSSYQLYIHNLTPQSMSQGTIVDSYDS